MLNEKKHILKNADIPFLQKACVSEKKQIYANILAIVFFSLSEKENIPFILFLF